MKHIKNKSCKSYLCNREQKAVFLVVSRSDVQFGLRVHFLRARLGVQVEVNFSSPCTPCCIT